jgi:hypothetical protein
VLTTSFLGVGLYWIFCTQTSIAATGATSEAGLLSVDLLQAIVNDKNVIVIRIKSLEVCIVFIAYIFVDDDIITAQNSIC